MAPGGYAWWYVDALSDDGLHGISLIAFVGSVFSPYYARARRRGTADPADHCALNVALYGPRGGRWAMTERGRAALQREASWLRIGPSALAWDGDALEIDIDEIAVPLPRRIRGKVRVIPHALARHEAVLDARRLHRWQPIAPAARVEVRLDAPALRWSGEGYWDCNHGDEPLEAGIGAWSWSRARLRDGTAVVYDVEAREGGATALALRFAADGSCSAFASPPRASLPASAWRIARATRSEDGVATLARTLEDTPFYARSLVGTRLFGHAATSVHESLDLDRFRSRIVQAMLPFRMPRRR